MEINSIPNGDSGYPFIEKQTTERRATETPKDTVSISLEPRSNSENLLYKEIQLSGRSKAAEIFTSEGMSTLNPNIPNGKTWEEIAEIPDKLKFGFNTN